MKTVVKVKLQPDSVAASALSDTLTRCNEAATWVAARAQATSTFHGYPLRQATYAEVRSRGLSSQTAQQVIRKVAAAYATKRSSSKNGRYGSKSSPRYAKIMSAPVTFGTHSAQPYDDRILSWDHTRRCVSIWTTAGRIKDVPFVGEASQLAFLAAHRKGETDLWRSKDGDFYLIATCDVTEPEVATPTSVIGVDMGIAVIAATASVDANDSRQHDRTAAWSGGAVTLRRTKNRRLRQGLQMKGTKSAKRLARKRSGTERRYASDVNHQISKTIVATAQRTGSAIALEELTGIRQRVRQQKSQRDAMGSWAFAQLRAFITYKAALAGVAVVVVNAAYTSQTCSECGHCDKKNRMDQATFVCRACGVALNADTNAAVNIARAGRAALGLVGSVNDPHADGSPGPSCKPDPSGPGS